MIRRWHGSTRQIVYLCRILARQGDSRPRTKQQAAELRSWVFPLIRADHNRSSHSAQVIFGRIVDLQMFILQESGCRRLQ